MQAALPSKTDVFSLPYPPVSVGGPAVESMSTIFHLGRMENDVNV